MLGDTKKMIESIKNTIWARKKSAYLRPSFIILGAPKAGTTALYEYLSQHKCILAPSVKEIDFFNCESRFSKGLDYYHSHFPVVGRKTKRCITFEASVSLFPSVS